MLEAVLAISLFWCRAEPVPVNGDDYLKRAESIEVACAMAVDACEAHYHNCLPLYCGEGESLHYEEPCGF